MNKQHAMQRGANCPACPLARRGGCLTEFPADGQPADLMVIGEAPGVQEAIKGVPFVGPSGQLLEQALTHIGIDPGRVAYTNAVLCQPLGADRDIPPEALAACAPRLAREIEQSGAQRLATLGAVATQALDDLAGHHDGRGITSRAGECYPLALGGIERTYTATLHPAFVLRSDANLPKLMHDLAYSINPHPSLDINTIKEWVCDATNIGDVASYIERLPRATPVAFDVETAHLQWYATPTTPACELLCLVICAEIERPIIIPPDMLFQPVVFSAVRGMFDRCHTIAHNGKFDQDVLVRPAPLGVGTLVPLAEDTMLMHYALQELGAHGLKALASEYLHLPDYEGELIDAAFKRLKRTEENRDYRLISKPDLYRYAAIDGSATLALYHIFRGELERQGLYERPYQHPLMVTARALPVVEQNGIGVDLAQLEAVDTMLTADQAEATEGMVKLIREQARGDSFPAYKAKGDGVQPKPISAFNPKSSYHIAGVLYSLFRIPEPQGLIKETKTKSGKEALEKLPSSPFVDLLRWHRRVAKMQDTYTSSLKRRADVRGLIHVDFKLTGTEIGRLAASNGDHGIPRPDDEYGAAIRSAFVALSGEVLVIGDYSQAELRAFAVLADVPFLLERYRAGKDVHTETCLFLANLGAPVFCDWHMLHEQKHAAEARGDHALAKVIAGKIKAIRTLAKNINFGNIYQGGPNGIAGMMGGRIPAKVIADVLGYYRKLMPEAADYAARQFAHLRQYGYVDTRFGRRRRFHVLHDGNEDDARKAAVHMVVSSTAADLNNLASARLVDQGVTVCHLIHDSIISRASVADAPHVASLKRATMQAVGAEFLPEVPWVADIDYEDDAETILPTRWVPTPARVAALMNAA